jgi:hypothetical protein
MEETGAIAVFLGICMAIYALIGNLQRARRWEAADDATPRPPESSDLCPKCQQAIAPGSDFCGHCGLPLTMQATTSPYESILAEGFAYREATSRPQKPIVVIGMWLLLGPTFLFTIVADVFILIHLPQMFREMRGVEDCIQLLVILIIMPIWTFVIGAILYKTTKNRERYKRKDETCSTAQCSRHTPLCRNRRPASVLFDSG